MDREKVIRGLEICIDRVPGEYNCYECPYEIDGNYCEINLAKDTLAILKEQEEKTGEWIYKHDNLWYCSRCGEIIYSETDDDLEIHHAYCSRCGAKMKQEGR